MEERRTDSRSALVYARIALLKLNVGLEERATPGLLASIPGELTWSASRWRGKRSQLAAREGDPKRLKGQRRKRGRRGGIRRRRHTGTCKVFFWILRGCSSLHHWIMVAHRRSRLTLWHQWIFTHESGQKWKLGYINCIIGVHLNCFCGYDRLYAEVNVVCCCSASVFQCVLPQHLPIRTVKAGSQFLSAVISPLSNHLILWFTTFSF